VDNYDWYDPTYLSAANDWELLDWIPAFAGMTRVERG